MSSFSREHQPTNAAGRNGRRTPADARKSLPGGAIAEQGDHPAGIRPARHPTTLRHGAGEQGTTMPRTARSDYVPPHPCAPSQAVRLGRRGGHGATPDAQDGSVALAWPVVVTRRAWRNMDGWARTREWPPRSAVRCPAPAHLRGAGRRRHPGLPLARAAPHSHRARTGHRSSARPDSPACVRRGSHRRARPVHEWRTVWRSGGGSGRRLSDASCVAEHRPMAWCRVAEVRGGERAGGA